ncbi:GntR family transcriptional regulator [Jeotgalicoccus coquinae]|uniref:DNA-binding transcriptional regulator YhcF (GntR family) n=1 Tax=Jeotgalicoccus coquinae TaxID=709509 RepID=A0A6V7RN48_9STAP|nr:GntR family transcriptional regulator [Jeotgalicoccus coquinae]MBB6422101.1 DNA-binding transcriptional regulator YhcF (GntR family) [Jeotgalicoccus coquinae]GGE18663.1 GntR family transcriptional regulator [Jeotgalicoccus coquinae]CAD2079749.1 putative HTH-type transcriptional regulator YurK [Jeotgalicoccus coquinae]
MKAVLDDSRPIFQQIYEMIEDDIIEGELAEGDQIPSTTEISKFYQVNRATAQKGLGVLVDEGYAYKQRGVGIFVAEGATKKLIEQRKKEFRLQFVKPLLEESKRLRMTKEEVIKFIEEGNND